MNPVRPLYVPPILYDKQESASLILRDGSTALIRLADQNDAIPMQEFVGRLSPESKHQHRHLGISSFLSVRSFLPQSSAAVAQCSAEVVIEERYAMRRGFIRRKSC